MEHITEIKILNTFGCETFSLNPKVVTILRGKNASGKSSILKALSYVFDGGFDPSVIRMGTTKSLVHFATSSGVTVDKITTPSGSKLEIKDANGLAVKSPQKFIATLADGKAVSPAHLLGIDTSTAAGKKALTAALLEIMPISFEPMEIAIVGIEAEVEQLAECNRRDDAVAFLQGVVKAPLSIDGIGALRKQIEETRRPIGRDRDEAMSTADSLARDLPTVEGAEAAKERTLEIKAALSDLDKEVQQRTEDHGTVHLQFMEAAQSKYQAAVDAAKIVLDDEKAAAREIFQSAKSQLAAAYAEASDPLKAELITLQEQISAADKAAGARATIEKMRDKAHAKGTEYNKLTCAISILDLAKQTKLESLPIPGLSFEDGDVLYEGVAWQHINTASRVQLVIQIMAMLSGNLMSMLLDDSEHLDSETKETLLAALREAGYQVIMAEVGDGPLTVQVAA